MVGGSRLRLSAAALGGLVLVWALLTACAGPSQYYAGSGLHDATVAEVAGGWRTVEGTRVVLRHNGTALVEQLDGQDFDFDYGWRLSGTGTWRLADGDGGQVVRLELTTRTRVDRRLPVTATGASAPEPPSTYSWEFSVDRDRHRALTLLFFYGDPDAGNAYVMTREAAS